MSLASHVNNEKYLQNDAALNRSLAKPRTQTHLDVSLERFLCDECRQDLFSDGANTMKENTLLAV